VDLVGSLLVLSSLVKDVIVDSGISGSSSRSQVLSVRSGQGGNRGSVLQANGGGGLGGLVQVLASLGGSSDRLATSDVNGVVVCHSRILEGVDVQQVPSFSGELHRPITSGIASLHKEGVVVSDKVPNK